MMSKLLLCFLFFLSSSQLLSFSFSFSNSTKLCSHQQALALLHLKQSFSIDNSSSWDCDSNGITSYPKTESWKKGSDCCSWDGVTCDWVTGHIIGLDLSCSWLFGIIHSNSTLFLLPHLRRLNLASNDFNYSSVSIGFGRFSSLMHLNLSYSVFSGKIAPEIFHLSNLVSLDLSGNYEAEFAPHGFNSLVQNLTKLQKLHLGGISISSVFPNSLLNRSSLISLVLFDCGLHGRFPDHDIHLPKLEVLDLWGNDDLSGNFPRFSENNSLMELDLSSTNLSGEISTSIGNLQSLQTLDLSDCGFSGSIPTSIGNLKSLKTLDLSNCEFSGSIPTSIGNLKSLRFLYLFSNNFSGQIPPSIGNLTNLQDLRFSDNLFNRTIPSRLYTLPSLVIDLSMNELHGSIPSSIFKFANLEFLYLYSNNLSGVLETSNFGKLRNLTSLDLSNNKLSSITSSNSNSILPSIQKLDLSNNNISGVWSWNMGKDRLWYLNLSHNSISGFEMLPWKNMQILDLHSNLLQGPLPTPPNSTYFFSVSHNKLSGEISSLICKASSMEVLDLSNNNLSGMLPHCLGNFSKDLSVLNLRRNRFHGIIPQTFLKGNAIRNLDFNDNKLEGPVPRSLIICRKLEVLDLGNNEINDTFPHWLGTLPKLQVLVLHSNSFHGHIGCSKIKSPFMSLRIIDLAHNDFEGHIPSSFGNLKLLESLDLSSNKLIGRIPQELTSLTFLEVLNLSQNHLTGFIPRGNQFDTFGNDSYNENSGLCGFPLSKKCIIDETLESSKEADAKFDGGFDWKITLMGYGCGLVIGLSLGCLVFLIGKPKRFV
ncbi:Receptor-like protein 12 [Vitis vinifera]|uniref:Receptor-like protein 12 n=1 Tax=Vitis vinifera TaxID=29760 RepID=A0A438CLL1_VITVI|nr:Receptor-like protein 12 [Vitis vinifera]